MNLSSLIIKKLVASLIGVYIGLTKLRLIDFLTQSWELVSYGEKSSWYP
jgi:hypothetical protein